MYAFAHEKLTCLTVMDKINPTKRRRALTKASIVVLPEGNKSNPEKNCFNVTNG